ncbi:MAG: hypothetical protein A2X94_04060 [Bdellovibrionales bacterium GWB1_55_8]|nr:MAG: hypothetical protein A2X94_04060 [Bdellovibrionales bacterium GWB1_55_8]
MLRPLDFEPLVDTLAKARVVMLGEATHGTHEFYELRRLISEWLIVKHGFRFLAVEGDWPPCADLNHYLHRVPAKGSAREALESFHRWPTWMWANAEIVRLAEWMRSHNSRTLDKMRAGFYGLDVYSLFESMQAVVDQLEKINPFLARRAKVRYQCFDAYHRNEKAYARSLLRFPEGCESEVIEVLQDLLRLRLSEVEARIPGVSAALFDARQNARVVKNAESYYRALIQADDESWNVRDRHMLETLDQLLVHHSEFGNPARCIVWAHNTHVGDYRATDMAGEGLVNLGGLARQKYGADNVALVGFGTHEGTVIASHSWDGPIERLRIPPARSGSVESAGHQLAGEFKAEIFASVFGSSASSSLEEFRDHRAIGVVYDPRRERWGNYVPTSLSRRYDAFVFVDRTQALEPFIVGADLREIPETWPRGQ